MKRIEGAARPTTVHITVDGRQVVAFEGECLAVALAAAGHRHLRDSPQRGTPRGAFCMMGVCQECLVTCDDVKVTSCSTPVRDGMRITLGRAP